MVNKEEILNKLLELKSILPEDFEIINTSLESLILSEFSQSHKEKPSIEKELAINKTKKTKQIPFRNSIDEALNDLNKSTIDIYDTSGGLCLALNRYKPAPEYYKLWLAIHLINRLANFLYDKIPKCLKIVVDE